MGYLIGAAIGGLLIVRVISLLVLWLMKSWTAEGYARIVAAHLISLLIATLLAGAGMANGGAFAPVQGLITYLPFQIIWFAFDSFRLRRRLA